MKNNETGVISQTITLFLRDLELFINNPKKILSTFGFPVLIALLIVLVSKEDFFETYDKTKSALFTIVCACIYVGMFNSLTIIVKERKIIKREYMTNMRIVSYISAQVILQAIICLVQSFIFLIIYWFSVEFPDEGLTDISSFFDYLVTLFLIMFSSDLLGLVISSAVKSSEIANLIAPIVIIIQLVLSGVLFTLEGVAENIANLTISKWGMEAIGSISQLNDLPLKIQTDFPMIPHEAEEIYEATKEHLLYSWSWMLLFALFFIIVSIVLLKRVEKDSR